MQPLGTKVYFLKRYSPSDSFCTFFSESALYLIKKIVATDYKKYYYFNVTH